MKKYNNFKKKLEITDAFSVTIVCGITFFHYEL